MDMGLIGLGVMGQNLVLNAEGKGYSVAVFNRTSTKTDEFMKERAAGKRIKPAYTLKELASIVSVPRKILIMVKAGEAVDGAISQLLPYLSEGDVLMDGGNSHFDDTERRCMVLGEKGVHFLGVGISGGEEGALNGASIMPGGSREAWLQVEKILKDISAKVNGEPCCGYLGPLGAGHFVKMAHNGIEYAEMEIIAEAYNIMRKGLGLSLGEIREIFLEWGGGELDSFLFDVTCRVLETTDEETGKPLLDVIRASAQQKGTGKWTSQAALDLSAPIPSIDAAVASRNISALGEERVKASEALKGPGDGSHVARDEFLHLIHDGLLCSRISIYAQGMALLRKASVEKSFDLDLSTIASIWRGGCIIRARILEPIRKAFLDNPGLENLFLDMYFQGILNEKSGGWRRRVQETIAAGMPCPVTSASLEYFDMYRSEQLPANLVQAQRDYFGAHGFSRIDRDGVFHGNWRNA